MKRNVIWQVCLVALAGLGLAACGAAAEPTATPTFTDAPTNTATATLTATLTATETTTPTITPTPTITLTPSETPSPTPDFVWGHINVEMASCRFGPGGGYLLRTTLYEGNEVEILGHMELNENWWFLHTTYDPDFNCWVSAELVTLGGDPALIYPIDDPHLVLPWTWRPYDPLEGVRADRVGNLVTVYWEAFDWLPGDQPYQDKYLVEVWVCQQGEFVFRAYSTNASSIQFTDEQTCSEASRGRAFGSDKHGYTGWVGIPWPQ